MSIVTLRKRFLLSEWSTPLYTRWRRAMLTGQLEPLAPAFVSVAKVVESRMCPAEDGQCILFELDIEVPL